MADDKTETAQDRQRINMSEEYEVRFWTEALGVTRRRLTQLVKQHGERAEDVRRALRKQHA